MVFFSGSVFSNSMIDILACFRVPYFLAGSDLTQIQPNLTISLHDSRFLSSSSRHDCLIGDCHYRYCLKYVLFCRCSQERE
jgi:hypothetical protein